MCAVERRKPGAGLRVTNHETMRQGLLLRLASKLVKEASLLLRESLVEFHVDRVGKVADAGREMRRKGERHSE